MNIIIIGYVVYILGIRNIYNHIHNICVCVRIYSFLHILLQEAWKFPQGTFMNPKHRLNVSKVVPGSFMLVPNSSK